MNAFQTALACTVFYVLWLFLGISTLIFLRNKNRLRNPNSFGYLIIILFWPVFLILGLFE